MRISIAGMLVLMAVVAVVSAALFSGSDTWRGLAFLLMLAVLLGGVLRLALGGWKQQPGTLGFAVFGWGFFILGLAHGVDDHLRQLTDPAARWAFDQANDEPQLNLAGNLPPTGGSRSGLVPPSSASGRLSLAEHRHRRANAAQIGQWLGLLAFALVGSVVGRLMARRRPGVAQAPSPG